MSFLDIEDRHPDQRYTYLYTTQVLQLPADRSTLHVLIHHTSPPTTCRQINVTRTYTPHKSSNYLQTDQRYTYLYTTQVLQLPADRSTLHVLIHHTSPPTTCRQINVTRTYTPHKSSNYLQTDQRYTYLYTTQVLRLPADRSTLHVLIHHTSPPTTCRQINVTRTYTPHKSSNYLQTDQRYTYLYTTQVLQLPADRSTLHVLIHHTSPPTTCRQINVTRTYTPHKSSNYLQTDQRYTYLYTTQVLQLPADRSTLHVLIHHTSPPTTCRQINVTRTYTPHKSSNYLQTDQRYTYLYTTQVLQLPADRSTLHVLIHHTSPPTTCRQINVTRTYTPHKSSNYLQTDQRYTYLYTTQVLQLPADRSTLHVLIHHTSPPTTCRQINVTRTYTPHKSSNYLQTDQRYTYLYTTQVLQLPADRSTLHVLIHHTSPPTTCRQINVTRTYTPHKSSNYLQTDQRYTYLYTTQVLQLPADRSTLHVLIHHTSPPTTYGQINVTRTYTPHKSSNYLQTDQRYTYLYTTQVLQLPADRSTLHVLIHHTSPPTTCRQINVTRTYTPHKSSDYLQTDQRYTYLYTTQVLQLPADRSTLHVLIHHTSPPTTCRQINVTRTYTPHKSSNYLQTDQRYTYLYTTQVLQLPADRSTLHVLIHHTSPPTTCRQINVTRTYTPHKSSNYL